jgi:hypothetical protein
VTHFPVSVIGGIDAQDEESWVPVTSNVPL